MKNSKINKGLTFKKEAVSELNTATLQSINSGQDTMFRTTILTPLLDFIAASGVTMD